MQVEEYPNLSWCVSQHELGDYLKLIMQSLWLGKAQRHHQPSQLRPLLYRTCLLLDLSCTHLSEILITGLLEALIPPPPRDGWKGLLDL